MYTFLPMTIKLADAFWEHLLPRTQANPYFCKIFTTWKKPENRNCKAFSVTICLKKKRKKKKS